MKPIRILLAILLCTFLLPGQSKKAIYPKGTSKGGPFSPGIVSGGTLHVAGQIGRDAKGQIPESFEDEVKATFANIKAVLDEAGYTFDHAVAVQVYLTDISLFQRMNAVYMTYFKEPRPARTTVGVSALAAPGARIEITVTAAK